jgi:proliferating cell nuclear antigen
MTLLVLKKGQLDIEEALGKMDWNTEEFEEELEIFAKTQSPQVRERLRKQYNRYMSQCGWPMEIVVVAEAPKRTPRSMPKMTQQIEIKPDSENEIQSPPQTTSLATIPPIPTRMEEPKKVETEEKTEESAPILPQETQETSPNTTETKPVERKELHGYMVLPDAMQVKNLFKTLSVLVDEATFKLTPQGLTLRAMDPSRVAMIDLAILRENCEEHLCAEEMKFCFSIERYLQKTLKNISKKDAIRIDIQTGLVEKINTRLFGKLSRQFSMPLLEGSDEDVPTPKINFMYSAKLVLENVNTLFKDLDDHVRIIGTQDGLTFEQIGDIENFTSTLKKGDDTVLDIEAKEDAKATYSVSYLKEILKALSSLTDIIELSYSTDMPIRITAKPEHLGTVSIFVAPRIETD